jgi:predicted N-formylglutamate amidohydrolase
LARSDPQAFEVINPAGAGTAVLVCDHAANRVPRGLGTLGLGPEQLADHIAWDPGAAAVARRLAVLLDAPLVLSGYSRLVIDCNRSPDHPASIADLSAGLPIPGNVGLTSEARAARAAALFEPYHATIDRLLVARARRTRILLSIHSFTPVLLGQARPWVVGVSDWGETRVGALLRAELARQIDGPIGENLPYPIAVSTDYTIPSHCTRHGLPGVMIEIRNDGLRTPAATAAWSEHLATAYRFAETACREDGSAG